VSAARSSLFFVLTARTTVSKKVLKQVKDLAESVLSRTDFFLVDAEVKGGREPVVWVYVDASDKGVNMDECAEISKELGFLLDAHELFRGNYRLNVSSPGLSRPLTDRRQYRKNKGRKAKVKFRSGGEYRKLEGILCDVTEQNIVIEKEGGSTESIDFNQLVETKIIPSI